MKDVQATLKKAGVESEMTYHGVVDRAGKLDFLRRLDVLSVPATYDEPKGMFLLEAMACGIPVVQPRRGAFIEIIEKTTGGILVDQDDPEALAEGLHNIWRDRQLAVRLGRQGFESVRDHYTVERSATRLLEVYQTVIGKSS